MVQLLIHHKWFIRLALATFWVAEIIAWSWETGFITYLAQYHLWLMGFIIFLTFKYLGEPFYGPFVKLTTQGGEIMEKSTKILCVIITLFATLIVLMAWDVSRTAILNGLQEGVLNPVYWLGVGFSEWLGTFPGLWILGSGLLGGLVLAVVINTLVRPRVHIGLPKSTGNLSSTSTYRSSSTPVDATTRPESPPVQKVEIEVKAAPETKEEEVTA